MPRPFPGRKGSVELSADPGYGVNEDTKKPANFELIENAADLDALVETLLGEKVLAFDTEADSFYHYFDKTCLVQVATRRKIYLIDPLALGGPSQLAALGPVFASPDICKIFHAAEYDLFVLKRDCSFEFADLFDTMISAQLLGYSSVGLAGLAKRHFDLNLPKDEQRSDWSRRPLTPKQLQYAAADVTYLIRLREKLKKELRAAKRMDWANEEFLALAGRKWPQRGFDKLGYLKIKGARRLQPVALSILRELYLLRDQRARDVDRPPFKVLGNRTLLEIAERVPKKLSSLSSIKGITELLIRRMGRDLLDAVSTGSKTEHGPIPKLYGNNGRRRIDRHAERRLVVLKKWRGPLADKLSMDPGVLCPNSALEAVACGDPQTVEDLAEMPELKGWFRREFGAAIVDVSQSVESNRVTPRKPRQS